MKRETIFIPLIDEEMYNEIYIASQSYRSDIHSTGISFSDTQLIYNGFKD